MAYGSDSLSSVRGLLRKLWARFPAGPLSLPLPEPGGVFVVRPLWGPEARPRRMWALLQIRVPRSFSLSLRLRSASSVSSTLFLTSSHHGLGEQVEFLCPPRVMPRPFRVSDGPSGVGAKTSGSFPAGTAAAPSSLTRQVALERLVWPSCSWGQ